MFERTAVAAVPPPGLNRELAVDPDHLHKGDDEIGIQSDSPTTFELAKRHANRHPVDAVPVAAQISGASQGQGFVEEASLRRILTNSLTISVGNSLLSGNCRVPFPAQYWRIASPMI